MKNKRKLMRTLFVLLLITSIGVQDIAFATPTVKKKEIEFSESMTRNRSKTIDIKNLQKIVEVEVDNGSVSHSVNNNKVTVNVSGGTSIPRYNSKKYSKRVSSSTTSDSNSFSSSKSYNSGGYSGTLSKDGGSYVYSGSPGGSKSYSKTRGPQSSSSFPSTIQASSEGYNGTLSKVGGYETKTESSSSIRSQTKYSTSDNFPDSINYSSGGYKGTLSKSGVSRKETSTKHLSDKYVGETYIEGGENGTGYLGTFRKKYYIPINGAFCCTYGDRYHARDCDYAEESHLKVDWCFTEEKWVGKKISRSYYDGYVTGNYNITKYQQDYTGEVTKETKTYTQLYSGTLTKPDTRRYRQDYSGEVYKPGDDLYYKYKVTIKYIDNSAPTVNMTSSGNKYLGEYGSIELKGTVTDTDPNQSVSVKGVVGDKEKFLGEFNTPLNNKSVSGEWSASELGQGKHSAYIEATDSERGIGKANYSGEIIVDWTKDGIGIDKPDSRWTNETQTPEVIITPDGGRTKAPIKDTYYSISRTTKPGTWSKLSNNSRGSVNISESGEWYLHVKTEDKAKNTNLTYKGPFKIDKENPNTPTINTKDISTNKTHKKRKDDDTLSNQGIEITLTDNGDKGGSGVKEVQYKLTGAQTEDWTKYSPDSKSEVNKFGKTTIYAKVVDNAGNESGETSKEVTIDNKKPTSTSISINPNTTKWVEGPFEVTLNKGEALSGTVAQYCLKYSNGNETEWTNYSGIINITEGGTTKIRARTKSNSGLLSGETTKNVNLDGTPPELNFSLNPEAGVWTAGNVEITAHVEDTQSGIDKITLPDGKTGSITAVKKEGTKVTAGNSTYTVSKNGTYKFSVVDHAKKETTKEITISNIDDVKPNHIKDFPTATPRKEDFKLEAVTAQANGIKVEVSNAFDRQSGLKQQPFEYKLNSGKWEVSPTKLKDGLTLATRNDGIYKHEYSWGEFSEDGESKPENYNSVIQPNREYKIDARLTDMANNKQVESIELYSLTDNIELSYNRLNDSTNKATLTIDLKRNPATTETMITRTNLINGESVVIEDWNKSPDHIYIDRVPTFATGYRYSAYARNGDNIVGTPSSVEIKIAEVPTSIGVKGFGADQYLMYDKNVEQYPMYGENNELFLFGDNLSGYIEWEIDTQATQKMHYSIVNPKTEVVADSGTLFGRTGEFQYKVQSPITKGYDEEWELRLESEYKTKEKDEKTGELKEVTKTEPMGEPYKVKVFQVGKLSKLLDFDVEETDNKYKVSYKVNSSELGGKEFLQERLKDLDIQVEPNGSKKWKTIEGKSIGKAEVDKNLGLTIRKQLDSKNPYQETLTGETVVITTNIDNFITELDDKEPWQLEVYVNTGKKSYTLPKDKTEFENDGYKLDVDVLKGVTQVKGETDFARWKEIDSKAPVGDKYTEDTMHNLKLKDPINAVVGVKVKKILPHYKFQTLNLQNEASRQSTLDAVGNPNTQYDKTFLYNKITSKMEPHGVTIHSGEGGRWDSILYYRSGKPNNLLMVSKDAITVYGTDLKKKERITSGVANYGSEVFNNKLYLATNSGIKEVDSEGKVKKTTYDSKTTGMATDGSKLFVIDSTGLKILGSNLEETQALTNEQIFGSNVEIKTIWASSGKIYVSKTVEGTEYVVIGK